MNPRQQIHGERFKRVVKFGKDNAAAFLPKPPEIAPTEGQRLFGELQSVITEITGAHLIKEGNEVRFATNDKNALRDTLLAQMQALTHTVRFIAASRRTPGITDRFRVPTRFTDKLLAERARSFAVAIEALKLRDEFLEHNHPPNFLEVLEACVGAFEHASESFEDAAAKPMVGSNYLDPLIERGLTVIRSLNTIVLHRFRNDPKKLGAWKAATHIAQPSRPQPAPPVPVAPVKTARVRRGSAH